MWLLFVNNKKDQFSLRMRLLYTRLVESRKFLLFFFFAKPKCLPAHRLLLKLKIAIPSMSNFFPGFLYRRVKIFARSACRGSKLIHTTVCENFFEIEGIFLQERNHKRLFKLILKWFCNIYKKLMKFDHFLHHWK